MSVSSSAPVAENLEGKAIAIERFLPYVNENPLDFVSKGITPEAVDAKREERIRYLADLGAG